MHDGIIISPEFSAQVTAQDIDQMVSIGYECHKIKLEIRRKQLAGDIKCKWNFPR